MHERDEDIQGPGDEVEPAGSDEQAPEEAPEAVSEPEEAAPEPEGAAPTDPVEPADPPQEEGEIVELVHEPTPEEILQEKLDQASARLRAVSKAYTDLQAEMHAFRERLDNQAKFKAERQAFEQARTFFDPVQNLKRSLANVGEDSPVRDGLSMVMHQFEEALKKLGMEEVPGVGSVFNPNLHEALALTPVTDPAQDGKVLMVHADGYTVNGKVLQAAQVVVGKYQEPAGEA